MEDGHIIQLSFEIFTYCLHLFLAVCSIYLTLKIRTCNDKLFMKKRNLSLFYTVAISNIVLIVSNGIESVCFVYFGRRDPMNSLMLSLSIFVWSPSAYAMLCLLVMRNWLIWYRYKWTYYISQSKWQQIINPDIIDTDNWFLLNNSKYGQYKSVSKIFVAAAICCLCILMPLNFWAYAFHFGDLTIMIPTLCVFFILFQPWSLTYVYCVWNTPSLDDAFAIHWECKMHAKILCLTFPVYLPGFIYMLMTGDLNGWIVCLIANSIQAFSTLFVSTYLVHRRVKQKSALSGQKDNVSNYISLKMVLENEISLNLFMNHLSHEFSTNIYVNVSRISQFQRQIKPGNVDKIDFQNVPISELKSGDSLIVSAKTQANKLFEKYVEDGSEYEINISGTMRNELAEILGNLSGLLSNEAIDLDALYAVFEGSVEEMMTLQSISFERFKQSDSFSDVKALFMHQASANAN